MGIVVNFIPPFQGLILFDFIDSRVDLPARSPSSIALRRVDRYGGGRKPGLECFAPSALIGFLIQLAFTGVEMWIAHFVNSEKKKILPLFHA